MQHRECQRRDVLQLSCKISRLQRQEVGPPLRWCPVLTPRCGHGKCSVQVDLLAVKVHGRHGASAQLATGGCREQLCDDGIPHSGTCEGADGACASDDDRQWGLGGIPVCSLIYWAQSQSSAMSVGSSRYRWSHWLHANIRARALLLTGGTR